MPQLSIPLREQAVYMLITEGASVKDVVQHLECGGVKVCRQTIWRLFQHYRQHKNCTPFLEVEGPRYFLLGS